MNTPTTQTPDAVCKAVAQLQEALKQAEGHESQSVMVKCADLRAILAAPDSRVEYAGVSWRCYHCGETFTDDRCARLHFGRDEDSAPACQIKAGAEQGLLGALRDAEYAAADARRAIADESTDAAKAYYAQATRHASALRNAEEAGYERGLADGRALSATSRIDFIESALRVGIFNTCIERGMSQDAAIATVHGTMAQLCVAAALAKGKEQ
ncbi:MAG: hypothetical protein ACTMKV_07245 [Sphingomonas parapaucimobilis]